MVEPLTRTGERLSLRALVRVSRPLFWLNTAILWLLALLVLERAPSPADLVMIGYFTFPFNLWLHGINDVHDYESDRRNARKGSAEGALLDRRYHANLLRQVLLLNLPFWLFALWAGGAIAWLLLTLFLFLGWAYSAPPIRGKSRPGLDSLINIAYLLPYPIALAWHGAGAQLWRASLAALVAFAAWSVASHAFTSIQDIEADRTGGITTIATTLGATRSALLALALYVVAALAAGRYGVGWGILVGLYALLVGWYLVRPERARANRLYRRFILLNSTLGFLVTVRLALASPPNLLWAALLTLSLVALVVAALRWGRREAPPLPGTGLETT